MFVTSTPNTEKCETFFDLPKSGVVYHKGVDNEKQEEWDKESVNEGAGVNEGKRNDEHKVCLLLNFWRCQSET